MNLSAILQGVCVDGSLVEAVERYPHASVAQLGVGQCTSSLASSRSRL